MKPIDVNKLNEKHLLNTVYKTNQTLLVQNGKYRFSVGDIVRISKHKTVFEKGYTINWTPELFKVKQIIPTQPISYLLNDLNDQPISGSFYEYELQKSLNSNIYLIEKIVRKSGRKVFVKWLGFDDKHNSWIHINDLM